MFCEFMGASYTESNGEKTFQPISPIYVNLSRVSAFYDHTLMMEGNKIRVMETYDDICRKFKMIDPLSTFSCGVGLYADDGK